MSIYRGLWSGARPRTVSFPLRRSLSTVAQELLSKPVQSYISTSNDPCLNLSIEHHLLQKSSPDSAILFLYINRPSIIIGRNQNPWLEVNLGLLNASRSRRGSSHPETEPAGLGAVDLVRRRSGGGTVFHDEGNVNWTVISPAAKFTRDKHAEMVVRALRSCGVDRARVNERHDIVLDQAKHPHRDDHDAKDTHSTPYTDLNSQGLRPLKVSGSAYKLTRARALHHGTCLLSSPNLNIIPHYLHSPAKPFITARGVESVSSPVGNVLLSNEHFIFAVQQHFKKMYPSQESKPMSVGADWLDDAGVTKGYKELQSPEWTFLQTPQFIISNASAETHKHDQPSFDLTVRNGRITESRIFGRIANAEAAEDSSTAQANPLLHEIRDWADYIRAPSLSGVQKDGLAAWLEKTLPQIQ